MKVVILGKGLMLANLVLGALEADAEIVGVFCYEYTCENFIVQFFKDIFNPKPEVTLIKQLGLKQLKFKSANSSEFRKFLIRENVDLVLVGTWKELIKKDTFNIPKIGMLNVHPSLLPKYRGPNPYMQTILHGEKFSGVTLHLMDEGFDSGAILSQKKVEILDTDTSKELREKSVRVARELVREFITDLNEKIIMPIAQVEKNSTYFENITGDERMLDFTKQSSEEIIRTVRALHPFLPCYITCQNLFFIVDPYNLAVIDEIVHKPAGRIIEKDVETCSLIIVCKDGKAVKFSKLKLYKFGLLTKYFIKRLRIYHDQA